MKGGHVSLAKLAEEWILRSSKIFQIPFSRDAYVNALKETEQFLWAGSEMDAVSFKIFTVFQFFILFMSHGDVIDNKYVWTN